MVIAPRDHSICIFARVKRELAITHPAFEQLYGHNDASAETSSLEPQTSQAS